MARNGRREELSAVRGAFWTLCLLQCASFVHTVESSWPCILYPQQPQQAPAKVKPPSWNINVTFEGEHDTTNGSLFQEQETFDFENHHGPDTERNQSRQHDNKGPKRKLPQCVCQCRMSDRAQTGRYRPRPCHLQWRSVFAVVTEPGRCCCSCQHRDPSSPGDNTHPGRRCRKLQRACWRVDTAPNASGQAQRNRLRSPALQVPQTARSRINLEARRVQHLLLMSENQRQEIGGGGGRDMDSLGSQVWVSIVAAVLLFLGHRPKQKTPTKTMTTMMSSTTKRLKEILSSSKLLSLLLLLLPGQTPFVSKSERQDEAIAKDKQSMSHSSTTGSRHETGSSGSTPGGGGPSPDVNEPSLQGDGGGKEEEEEEVVAEEEKEEEAVENDFGRSDGARRGEGFLFPDWCFSFRSLSPAGWSSSRSIRVAPASQQFLPNVRPSSSSSSSPSSSSSSDRLDYLGYRLASLAAVPPACSLSRVRLAEAGFHYDPSADPTSARCHRCPALYGLQQEPAAPSPLTVHQSMSPQCPMVLAATQRLCAPSAAASAPALVGSDVSGTLADRTELSEDGENVRGNTDRTADDHGADTRHSRVLQRETSDTGFVLALAGSVVDHRMESRSLAIDGSTEPSSSFSSSSSSSFNSASTSSSSSATSSAAQDSHETDSAPLGGQLRVGHAVYPQFSTAQSRLQTFQGWPSRLTGPSFAPASLVNLGFYYAGYEDCVRCFYCGVGLKSWDAGDDPLTEHVRWRPQCVYLRATQPRGTLQRLLTSLHGASRSSGESQQQQEQQQQEQQQEQGGTEGSSGSSSAEDPAVSSVVRQLTTMGFSLKDIDDTRRRLRAAGQPETVHHMLQLLLPQNN